MSGWRALVRELHELGGGPVPRVKFSNTGTGLTAALTRARSLGLVRSAAVNAWEITRKGRAYVEGRYELVELKSTDGPGRGKARFVATWLAALPPRNSVRLDPDAVVRSYRNTPVSRGKEG